MATLVTGAGLIGTAFAQFALARGETVIFLDPEPRAEFLRMKLGESGYRLARKDVRDLPALIEAIRSNSVDTVVHTAGLIGPRVQEALGVAFDINLGGTRNVAEAVRLSDVRRLVHISTFGVYDRRRPASGPITENFPRGPSRGYGNYKAGKELILEAYAAVYGFELIMLRPANVFGLGHFWSGSSGGRKMQALVEAALTGGTARISATDAAPNEYVYAKDVGRAVDLAATVRMPAQATFNIGNGYVTPVEELLTALQGLCPALNHETEAGARPQENPAPLDISAAKRHLGWEPRFTISSALEDYLKELAAARTK
jgi:nucleoside-diphosphate-sugar epimerase